MNEVAFEKSGILLAGGGIDSTALMAHLKVQEGEGKLVEVMHVNYGQKAWYQERLAVEYFTRKYGMRLKTVNFDIGQVGTSAIMGNSEMATEHVDNRLEGRNIILISLAATYACTRGVRNVWVGFHQEPQEAPFPDATKLTLDHMDHVLRYAYGYPLNLYAPFYEMTRLEIFKRARMLDQEIETKSFTCYEGGVHECGKCTHCVQKKQMVEALCAA